MVVLDINPSISGIAGDMMVASLLDLHPTPEKTLNHLVEKFQKVVSGFTAELQIRTYEVVEGKYLRIKGELSRIEANELENKYDRLVHDLEVKGVYEDIGKYAIRSLIQVEKEVHKTEEVKFHELGTLDTLFDIISTVYLMQDLEIDSISLHPVATGKGKAKTHHGILPIPTPATQKLLEMAEVATTAGTNGEKTTPTGASLILSLVKHFPIADNIIWKKSGYGFGTKEFSDKGNFVRCRIGEKTEEQSSIVVLETNLDDVTGEILGHTLDKLLEEGALDVNYYPIMMKKNRPAYCLRVLTNVKDIDRISQEIMNLTGTLGIRVMKIDRHIGNRDSKTLTFHINEWERDVEVTVKSGSRKKIEFDDIERIANEVNLTPLQVTAVLSRYLEEQQ